MTHKFKNFPSQPQPWWAALKEGSGGEGTGSVGKSRKGEGNGKGGGREKGEGGGEGEGRGKGFKSIFAQNGL